MRTLLPLPLGVLLAALILASQPSHAQSTRHAQAATPPAPQTAPRTLRQISPPKQINPASPAPGAATRPAPTAEAKSTLLSADQENKLLKEQIRQKDLIILNLTARLEQAEKAGQLVAIRAKQLGNQVEAMTKRGGSHVRAYCENERVSRNTAGASTNCASFGYACEDVSGLCFSRCANTTQCARGWVCDPSVSNCVRVR